MKVDSYNLNELDNQIQNPNKDLVFCAFDRISGSEGLYNQLKTKYKNANIVIFSTSGHFVSSEILDETPIVSAIEFENSSITMDQFSIADFATSFDLGESIGKSIKKEVKGVCIISDGGLINGTELISGINANVLKEVPIFGGMAGDGTRFQKTLVGANQNPEVGNVVIIQFFGEGISIKSNSDFGWTSLGLEFKITKSESNKLIEIDKKNAYDVLYEFLAPESEEKFAELTLYYPFLLKDSSDEGVIRTPILVNHKEKTLVYAGNMPEGSMVKLMKSGTMQLLDSTLEVAQKCVLSKEENSFVLAISCVGRRVVLEDMANEEFTEIQSIFGERSCYFGFYSYGEFSRSGFEENCKLHNQTLTLAVLQETI